MSKLTKAELTAKLSEASGLSKKDTDHAINVLGDVITEELLAGNEITLPGIGVISVKTRAARKGRNPQTGEELDIAASKGAHLSASKTLKDKLNP